MKIAIIWKWWAGKTMISVILINLLKKYKKIVAIDADSNKNIIDYVFPEIKNKKTDLWDLMEDILKKAEIDEDFYKRKYFPKDWVWVFETNKSDEIFEATWYNEENLSLIQLWDPKCKR